MQAHHFQPLIEFVDRGRQNLRPNFSTCETTQADYPDGMTFECVERMT